MKGSDIRHSFLDFFAAARPPASIRARRWCRRAIRRCCSPTPAWCQFKDFFLGAATPPSRRAPSRCRSACASRASTTTSRTSARARATTPSSRCSATSRSATTSRTRRSRSPGSWSPRSGGCQPEHLFATVYEEDDEASSSVAQAHGPARRAHRPLRQEGQLLGDGRDRTVRTVQRDLRRPPPRPPAGVVGRGQPKRPLPRDLEPGLHAVRARTPTAR